MLSNEGFSDYAHTGRVFKLRVSRLSPQYVVLSYLPQNCDWDALTTANSRLSPDASTIFVLVLEKFTEKGEYAQIF